MQNSPDSEDNQTSSSSNVSGGSTGSTVNKPGPPVVPPIPQQKCSICGKVLERNNRFHERQCRKRQEILDRKAEEEARLEEQSKRNYGYFDEKGDS